MDKKEREELELQRSSARVRCREVWPTIVELERVLGIYKSNHRRWREKFEKADRALAMEDRKIIPAGARKKKETRLNRAQIIELLRELDN